MEPIKRTCKACRKEFWVIVQEQKFLKKMGLPLPKMCPSCRQIRRLKDRGERSLYRTTCQKCNKQIIVTYNPENEQRPIYCKICYLDYFEKNPVLIKEQIRLTQSEAEAKQQKNKSASKT